MRRTASITAPHEAATLAEATSTCYLPAARARRRVDLPRRRRPRYGRVVVEWFMPSRRDLPPETWPDASTVSQTELADLSGGRVVVETRRLRAREWETTICPGDDIDPSGPEAAVFARCRSRGQALTAHDQAVEFAAYALHSTVRRASP